MQELYEIVPQWQKIGRILSEQNVLCLAERLLRLQSIPDQKKFFRDVFDLMKPKGKLLIIEPDFIVSGRKFKVTLEIAKQTGFIDNEKLNLLFSKSRILQKE